MDAVAFETSSKTELRRKNYSEDEDKYSATQVIQVVPSFASAVCTVISPQGRRSTCAAILCSVCRCTSTFSKVGKCDILLYVDLCGEGVVPVNDLFRLLHQSQWLHAVDVTKVYLV